MSAARADSRARGLLERHWFLNVSTHVTAKSACPSLPCSRLHLRTADASSLVRLRGMGPPCHRRVTTPAPDAL